MPKKDKTKKKKKELHLPIKALFCGLVFFVELILVILLAYFAITINAVGDYIYVPTILLLIIDFILGMLINTLKVLILKGKRATIRKIQKNSRKVLRMFQKMQKTV